MPYSHPGYHWHEHYPKHVAQRRYIASHCPHHCYLAPHMQYPICDSHCRIHREGILAAQGRANINATRYRGRKIAVIAKQVKRKTARLLRSRSRSRSRS
jgi:hypothetical protein